MQNQNTIGQDVAHQAYKNSPAGKRRMTIEKKNMEAVIQLMKAEIARV